MIRRATVIQLIAFAVITVLGVTYVSARYLGVGDILTGRSYVVSVDLAESGGIYAGAEVTYRGVTIGRVDQLRLSDDGVLVDLRIEGDRRVPADTDAVVENRSAVGEQYLDLQPAVSDGPFLAAGDTIARVRTRTPVATETLLLDVDRLVNSVDRQDLRTVVSELGKAFAGGGRDLQRLLDAGDRLTLAATDALPETLTLINDGEIVLDTQRDTGPAIRSFSADLADLTETLAGDRTDADLRTVLDRGVVASGELDQLLTDNRPEIAGLLTNMVTVGEVTVVRIDGVEQLLATYPSVVAGGYTVVQRNSEGRYAARFGLAMNPNDPPPCTRGYSSLSTSRPEAQDGQVGAPNLGAMCAEPRGSGINVRGSQNAPYPRSEAASPLPSSYLLNPGVGPALGTSGSTGPTVVNRSAPAGLTGSAALEYLLLGGGS